MPKKPWEEYQSPNHVEPQDTTTVEEKKPWEEFAQEGAIPLKKKDEPVLEGPGTNASLAPAKPSEKSTPASSQLERLKKFSQIEFTDYAEKRKKELQSEYEKDPTPENYDKVSKQLDTDLTSKEAEMNALLSKFGGIYQKREVRKIEQRNKAEQLGATEALKTPNDPFGIGATIVKQFSQGIGDQIPKAMAQAAEVGVSAMQASNMDEYIKRRESKNFQKYVRERDPDFQGDGGIIDKAKGMLTPFDIDKYLAKYKDQFIKDKGLEDVQKGIAEKQPHIIQRRREIEEFAQKQNKESEETLKGVTLSYKDIKSPGDAVRYATNLASQFAWQAPLTVVTKGLGGLALESATVYENQVDAIVAKHNKEHPDDQIDRDEAIKRNMDKPAEGQFYALAATALDYGSAGGLLKLVKKGGSSLLEKSLAAATETITEPIQGTLEEMGGAKGAGKSVKDAFVDSWTKNLSQRIDEAAGGFFGGSVVSMVSGNNVDNDLSPEALKIKVDGVSKINKGTDISDTNTINQAAAAIEQEVNKPQANEEIKVEPVATIDPSLVLPETTEEKGAEVQEQNQEPTSESQTINQPDNAIQERSPEEVLQRKQGEVGETRSTGSGVERSQQGNEATGTQGVQSNDQQKQETQIENGKSIDTQQGSDQVATKGNEQSTETNNDIPRTDVQGSTQSSTEPIQPSVSGIKKELAPEEVVNKTPIDKRTNKEVLEQGKQDVDSGKVNPQAIIDGVKNETRALQPNEVAALVYHKAKLDNQLRDASERLIKAKESGDYAAQTEAEADLKSLESQINDYYEMSVKTANQQSMAFRLRKMLLDSEYNLQSQVTRYKAKNNGQIEPEVLKKFEELDKQLKEANAKIDKLIAQQEDKKSESYLELIKEKERAARRKAITQERKKKINAAFDSLKVDTSNKGMMSASVIPGITLLPHVWNGSVEVIKQAVLAGADVTEAIQAGIDYIKKNTKDALDEKKYISGMTPLVQKIVPKVKPEETSLPYMNEKDKLVIPKQLVKDLVANGVKDVNDLVEQIHSLIKESLPDVAIREVRDAFTQYGKISTMSQDEIDVEIRKLKRVGKNISILEDIKNKIRPLRSGLQRDKLEDDERKMQREIREAMKELPMDTDEEQRVWKSALDKIKSRLTNQIADLEDQINTGEKTPKKKGVEYDEEALKLQARRDELKAILESIEGKSEISEEQRIRMAEKALDKSLAEYERRIKEGDFSKKPKREAPESETITELRAKRDAAKTQLDKIKEELGIADKERLEQRKKSVAKSISEYERRIKEGDFVTKKKKEIEADEELSKAQAERERIKYEFDVAQEKNRLANRTTSEKVADFGLDVANLPKTMLSSSDFSAAFRQGIYLMPRYPLKWAKAFVEMFRQAASQKKYEDFLFNLKGSDIWPLIQQSKLFIADNNAKISAREEQFMSHIAKKVPLLGQTIKIYKWIKIPGLDIIGKSNRAYAGFLNKLRLDVFAHGVDELKKDGKTFASHPEEFKALADFINNATGRGKLLKAGSLDLEKAAPVLNTIFFSPRFLASRFNLINPVYYAKLPKPIRIEALKTSLSFLVFGMAVLALFSTDDDWEVELNPLSSDFGKLKKGNTRYDIWGGVQGIVRNLAQVAMGEMKDVSTKNVRSKERLSTIGTFFRSKLAPTPGTLINILDGEDLVGGEVTLTGELIKNTVPLYLQDMGEIFKNEGTAGALETGLPAMFGIGVQNYAPKVKPQKDPFEIKELDIDKMIEKSNKQMDKVLNPY